MSNQYTGGHLLSDLLRAEEVEHVFGIVDGTYLMLISALSEQQIELITPRHEATALHMAGAYARMRGQLGVAIASNGPGVANALSGVAVEQAEGNRVLLITSSRRPQISLPDRGGAYQCFDQCAAIRPISKWSESVRSADRLIELTHAALRQCWIGRPGVVHLDIPETIINGPCPRPESLSSPPAYRSTRAAQASTDQLQTVLDRLSQARLAALHVGSGVIHAAAQAELAELAERLQLPVTTSWAARGVISENHPLLFPLIHTDTVNAVHQQADVVLCLGSDLGETDWWARPPNWRAAGEQCFIQVDIDPTILGRNHRVDLAIQADVRGFLQGLLRLLDASSQAAAPDEPPPIVKDLLAQRDAHRRSLDEVLHTAPSTLLTAHVADACNRLFPDHSIAVIDGGNTAVWSHFYLRMRSANSCLSTAHFGHLGAGLGQALGAAVACPDRPVFCIIGDGAMGFHPQEIETATRHRLPVIFLVCCDRQWGMVKLTERIGLEPVRTLLRKTLDDLGEPHAAHPQRWEGLARAAARPLRQRLGPDHTINADLGETRFYRIGEAMGAYGLHITRHDQLDKALKIAISTRRCAVIQVDVDSEKHLWPPGLKAFKQMHQEPSGEAPT